MNVNGMIPKSRGRSACAIYGTRDPTRNWGVWGTQGLARQAVAVSP
jgi:hypothetical protein